MRASRASRLRAARYGAQGDPSGEKRMADVPRWQVQGDRFDTCSCNIPCPCTFAQPPTNNHCEGILAWHIRHGQYGDVRLDGLSVMALGTFDGNIWEGKSKSTVAMFIDE